MNILSIEAAASPASVALSLDGAVVELVCKAPRAQAENLLELVDKVVEQHGISLADLDGLAAGRGPGSFTGLRVAAALVQGLAYSAEKPVANVSSLTAMAHGVMADSSAANAPACPLLVCLDARKAQVYCALYESDEQGHPVPLSKEAVLDPAEVVARFGERRLIGVGNGFDAYPELGTLDLQGVVNVVPSARAVALRAASGAVPFADPYLATPEYVRDNVTHGS